MSLSGRVALVTGASQGIGRACALKLATAGAVVAVASGPGCSRGDTHPRRPCTACCRLKPRWRLSVASETNYKDARTIASGRDRRAAG